MLRYDLIVPMIYDVDNGIVMYLNSILNDACNFLCVCAYALGVLLSPL